MFSCSLQTHWAKLFTTPYKRHVYMQDSKCKMSSSQALPSVGPSELMFHQHHCACPRFRELLMLLPPFAIGKQSKSKQASNFMHCKRLYERKREFIPLKTLHDWHWQFIQPIFTLYLHHLLIPGYKTKPRFPFPSFSWFKNSINTSHTVSRTVNNH